MYLTWAEQTITDFSDENINRMYESGFLFTREGKGAMYQTRSLRIDLEKFELSSENRRVLRKIEDLRLKIEDLPMKNYDWKIGKMAKDFYNTKFGEGTFSANKVKELLTSDRSNFNKIFIYNNETDTVGYCITLKTDKIIHYAYPFYLLSPISYLFNPNTGLGMMLKAIIWAKEARKKYVYLGSAKDAKAKYKLQFDGLEWFDGKEWKTDIDELKKILK